MGSVEILDDSTVKSFDKEEEAFKEWVNDWFNKQSPIERKVTGSVEILDGSTIRNFVKDDEIFNEWVNHRFNRLDLNRDGLLSYVEMVKEFEDMRLDVEKNKLDRVYGEIFSEFDRNSDGSVDLEEFAGGMKRMIMAMAEGIGFMPVEMMLEDDGFLKKAVERESSISKSTA